jgi:hypothetical protein
MRVVIAKLIKPYKAGRLINQIRKLAEKRASPITS